MDIKKLSSKCFLNSEKRLIPYTPELNVKIEKYNESLWKRKFPSILGVNIRNLQLTNIGVYSISTPMISNNLILFIKDLSPYIKKPYKNLSITETNGGLGGFSIRLAEHFNELNIVEINPMHSKIIVNNLKEYGFEENKSKNIQIINDDYMNVMDDLYNDIIISDPPWGGPEYATAKSIRLGMNNIDITCVINHLYDRNRFRIFILMTAKNFDLQSFINIIKSPDIVIKNMGKHYFIAVINKKYLLK